MKKLSENGMTFGQMMTMPLATVRQSFITLGAALMMEYLMDLGYELDEMASDMSYLADEEGVTGFMHGAAATVIAHCWIHGEEFRQWYNLHLQIGNEGESANESGGILNPALLNIG